MISFNETHLLLMRSKSQLRFVGISEVRHLSRVLQPTEEIMAIIKGWHQGAVAILCATSQRILVLPLNEQFPQVTALLYNDVREIDATKTNFQTHITIYAQDESYTVSAWRKKYAIDMLQFLKRHLQYVKETSLTDDAAVYALPEKVIRTLRAPISKML